MVVMSKNHWSDSWLYFGLAFVGGYCDAAGYVLAKTFTGHITGTLVDCRKVTITSCYASKLVWRQTAKCPSAATNVRNSAASLNRVLYRPATSFAPSSS